MSFKKIIEINPNGCDMKFGFTVAMEEDCLNITKNLLKKLTEYLKTKTKDLIL